MSGDVQPRKRKEKRKRKDELGFEEHRGTSAALGEGDAFIHFQLDHGTGGHWCAKIIFFSLLAILIALIGLIILENRGLSELEANTVESRYSGVLEGWLEDAPEDDHHDEHTLELKHHDDDDHESEDVDKSDLNLERIEREVIDDEPVSAELPNTSKNDEVDDSQQVSKETRNEVDDDDDDDDEFSEEIEDDELPLVEHITAPAGKPFEEVDDESLTEQSPGPDSLADEEEYEKQQEQLRREDAEASHMWLKLFVGGALLVATHALIRRGSGAHEVPTQHTTREETPGTERRMTLIPEESPSVNTENVFEQKFTEKTEELTRNIPSITKLSPTPKHSEDDDQNEIKIQDHQIIKSETSVDEKELYSDEDDEDEQEMPEDEVEAKDVPEGDEELDGVVEEEIADDVEIIEDEQVEEEEEEEISDVDDSDLLHRLEAKYGRLPEPERFGSKPKDGGNSIEDEWPGEPTDAYWREELNKAEEELQQGWLD